MQEKLRALFARENREKQEMLSGLPVHVGSGGVRIEGWVNVDIHDYPGVDRVLDIRNGLPFESVPFIFAEHFIEHLSYTEGREFLVECRRALRPEGVLRLSTPNLDWVWTHQYHLGQWTSPDESIRDCFWMNKAFRGWGHQFLYNGQTLCAVLRSCGFESVELCRYGESRIEALRNLEHHEQYPDSEEIPHVVVVEAYGLGTVTNPALEQGATEFLEAAGVR